MNTTVNLELENAYWFMLKNISDDLKLKPINRLSDSLVNKKDDTKTQEIVDLFYGCWHDNKDADELVKEIRESRNVRNRDIIFEI